ncbi:unnamed protein product [Brachionus calyciflorus]|uniref:Uncharacterized protein n=1 Tax=Brachionus calyciflorus TaxID=104777 RepID=A0A813USB1_9BILA|nr:unnamed protein product [Brachionus calyciflorus]
MKIQKNFSIFYLYSYFGFILSSELVYLCNFDSGSCPNSTFKNDNIVEYTLIDESYYRITDVSSITNLTSNGMPCKIPFTLVDIVYNHCDWSSGWYCKTLSGSSGRCITGKYLSYKTNPDVPSSTSSGLISIKLPSIGSYEATFYILMHVESTFSNQLKDYINISLNYPNNNQNFISDNYNYSNIGRSKYWNKKSLKFYASQVEIQFRVEFGRLSSAKQGYFGFDQIEIYKLNDKNLATQSNYILSSNNFLFYISLIVFYFINCIN